MIKEYLVTYLIDDVEYEVYASQDSLIQLIKRGILVECRKLTQGEVDEIVSNEL